MVPVLMTIGPAGRAGWVLGRAACARGSPGWSRALTKEPMKMGLLPAQCPLISWPATLPAAELGRVRRAAPVFSLADPEVDVKHLVEHHGLEEIAGHEPFVE